MADLDELRGQSPAIEAVRRDLRRLVGLVREGRRLPAVLIQGETGTGKGLVAKLLHRHGPRAAGPFVDLNCSAIPATLLEGELFGYERGAFTDARRAKPGLFQTSSGGMLFLDEVALIPEALQAKLLTAIEEQAVRRLGATVKETFDAWIVSATNTDLEHAIRERRFRDDLYHRLAVLTLRLPPLRERAGDAVILAQSFLEQACRHYGLPAKSLTRDARARVAEDPWRGNVRELHNVAERLALLVDGPEVTADDFDAARGADDTPAPRPASTLAQDREREHLLAALEAAGWNITRTAERLGISRNTLRARMDRWNLRARRTAVPEIRPATLRAPTLEAAAEPWIDAVRWEQRHVTALRVAVSGGGNSALYASHILGLAAERIRGFGGRVETLGRAQVDGSFGAAPVENAARRAAGAAMALHKAVAEIGRGDVAATTAIHTEQTTVAHAGNALVIEAAARAALDGVLARLIERVPPGAVKVSGATAPFLVRHFELRSDDAPPGADPPSFTIVRPDPTGLGAWRRLTRFVGRQAEMEALRSCWQLARGGSGQVAGLVGGPGVGKSRLLLEFTRELDPSAALVLRMATSAAEDPARSRPAAALLAGLFAIDPSDGREEIKRKVAARLDALGLGADLLSPFAAMLDVEVDDRDWARLDVPQRARRTLHALGRLIVRESLDRPVVLVIEDLHWIDADTQLALDRLVEAVPDARVLLAVAYRPEYRPAWSERAFFTGVRVDPLPERASAELLDDLLGRDPEIDTLKSSLLAWTEGNPFFLEEGVRTLVETGALTGVVGAYRSTGHVDVRTLPATVEDTVAARVHRLPADARHVLQCGAAIGVEFVHVVLHALAELGDEALAATLRVLEEADFVYPVVGAAAPAHAFKHALTHLVAYQSLPPERRRDLHAQALGTLESLPPGQLETSADALAEHAFRAELWERAAAHLQTAGMRALGRSATRAAVEHLARAVTALDRAKREPELVARAIDVRLDLRYALTILGQYERALPHLRQAEALAAELDDTPRLARVVSFLANGLYLLGDHAGAIASAGRATEIAQRLNDFATRVTANIYAGRALHALGRYREATETFGLVIDMLGGAPATERAGLPVLPAAYARSYRAMGFIELGDFDAALATVGDAMALAEASEHLDTIQWACYALGLALLDRGDAEAALAPLERALSICRAAELPVYVPRAAAALGHARVMAGRADGVALIESAAADGEAASQRNQQARFLARLAEVYSLTGRAKDAADRAARSLALAREHGERGTEAHALWALAVAAEMEPRAGDARRLLEASLALATELGMEPLAARGRLRLGRLARLAGHQEEAATHLAAAHRALARLQMTSWKRETAAELALLG